MYEKTIKVCYLIPNEQSRATVISRGNDKSGWWHNHVMKGKQKTLRHSLKIMINHFSVNTDDCQVSLVRLRMPSQLRLRMSSQRDNGQVSFEDCQVNFFFFLFLSHSWHSQKALESSLPALEAPLCHQLQQLEAPESSLSSATAYSAHSFKGSKVQSEQSLAKSSLPNFEFCFFFYSPPPPPPPPHTHTQKAQPKSSGVKPFTYNSIFSPQPQRLLLSPVSSHRSEQFLASSSLSKCFFPLSFSTQQAQPKSSGVKPFIYLWHTAYNHKSS